MTRWSTRLVSAVGVAILGGLFVAPPAGATRITSLPTVEATAPPGEAGAYVTFETPTISGVPGTETMICSASSGAYFPLGLTSVRCEGEDPVAGDVTALFSVEVREAPDTQGPTIAGLHDITITVSAGSAGVGVGYGAPQATDDRGTASAPRCSPASGSFFRVGTTSVTCTSQDGAGNVGQASFRVVIIARPGPRPPSSGGATTPGAGFPTAPGTLPGQPLPGTTVPGGGLCYPCVVTTTTTAPSTTAPTTQPTSTAPLTVSPLLAGRGTSTVPAATGSRHQPPRDGGPSPTQAAVGSLGVLSAVMVIALLARWRFDRVPL